MSGCTGWVEGHPCPDPPVITVDNVTFCQRHFGGWLRYASTAWRDMGLI